jgi:predicted nucleic acid-binding protein
MVLLDSNVFIVDRFFPNDALYPQNRAFVDKLDTFEAAVSSFTLLEICGVAGFRLSRLELESWLYRFTSRYPVLVLDLFGLKGRDAEEWWSIFASEVAETIARKMSLGDAVLLREAENYGSEAIVTWNTKDFHRRTRLPVLTPTAFLKTV